MWADSRPAKLPLVILSNITNSLAITCHEAEEVVKPKVASNVLWRDSGREFYIRELPLLMSSGSPARASVSQINAQRATRITRASRFDNRLGFVDRHERVAATEQSLVPEVPVANVPALVSRAPTSRTARPACPLPIVALAVVPIAADVTLEDAPEVESEAFGGR